LPAGMLSEQSSQHVFNLIFQRWATAHAQPP
jgi:hypothetical protein